jgi:glycosyltransferase involved in cell wall biosynthesis
MKVIQVVAGLDAGEGGPVHTLPELWSRLSGSGMQVRAYTTSARQVEETVMVGSDPSVSICCVRQSWPRLLKRAPLLRTLLAREMRDADLCHNHGCWLYPNWVAAQAAQKTGKPLIISPLGHLDPWSLRHHAWRKRLIRMLVEESSWRYCHAFVAKTEMEADNLRKLGIRRTIRVIPNGIDAREWEREVSGEAFLNQFPSLRGKRLLLFLSRIHRKKGLRMLLSAWGEISRCRDDWRLVVAGDDCDGLGSELRGWADRHLRPGEVCFTGALEGELKRSAFAAASLFILPSYSENFGQVVLEALAAGLPVITTRGCPWSEIESRGCGWWVDADEAPLRKALCEAMALEPSELRERGSRGRRWVLGEFDWGRIAADMAQFYSEVLSRGPG